MKVYVTYNGESRHWGYYYFDEEGFKTKVSGFDNHILAKHHASDVLKKEIEFIYK